MKNKTVEMKDTELANVTGGMKIIVEEQEDEDLSWWETLLNFFFKIKP